MTSRALLAGFGMFALCSSGCARAPRAPEELPPPVPLSVEEVSSLLEDLRRQSESVMRYQGLVRVRGRGPEGGFDARLAVIFERPRRLRVELLGPFGATRWSAVADEEGIAVYFPGPRHYLREAEVEEVVARLLGVRMSAEEIVAILSGVGLPPEAVSEASGYRRGAKLFLELDRDAGRTVEIDPGGQVVAARAREFRVLYPSSWKSRRRPIPDEIAIENETIRARLAPEDVDVNLRLDPESFLLDIPATAVRLRPAEVEGQAVFVIGKDPE